MNASIDEKVSNVLKTFRNGYGLSVANVASPEICNESKGNTSNSDMVVQDVDETNRCHVKYFYVNVEDTKASELLWYTPDFHSQDIDQNEYPSERLESYYEQYERLDTEIQSRIESYFSVNDIVTDDQQDKPLDNIINSIKFLHDVQDDKDFICCFFDNELEQMINTISIDDSSNTEKRALINRFATNRDLQSPYYFTLAHRNAVSEIRSFFNLRKILTDKLEKEVLHLFSKKAVL